MATTVFILVFSAALVSAMMTSEMESKDSMTQILRSLENEEEKINFLKFHLLRGVQDWAEKHPRPPKFLHIKSDSHLLQDLNISKENAEKFLNFDIPKESSRKLLDWTKVEFNLSTRDILQLVKSKICYRPPCLPDIGELCCPW